jgi:hypothetical protein
MTMVISNIRDILRALHPGSRLARLRVWTFGALVLFDLTLYFDWALRWEHGFAFLWRSEWQIWSVSCVGGWLLCVAWLVREGAGFVRHFGLTFLAFSYGCFVASSGNPRYDWLNEPAYYPNNFLKWNRNVMVYATDGGLTLAAVAALVHGVVGRSLAKHVRWPAPWSLERWLGAAGAAFLMLGPSVTERRLETTSVQELSRELEPLRSAISVGALLVGGVLALASAVLFVRRVSWLRRVRAGGVAGFRIEDAPAEGRRALAALWPLPRKWFGRVLVQVDAGVARPVALVPPLRFGTPRKSPADV